MYITKQKQAHRYREQTSGYQWGEGRRRGKIAIWNKEIQTTMCKIDKPTKTYLQHKEIQPLFCNNSEWSKIYKDIESLCCTLVTNTVLQINYISI